MQRALPNTESSFTLAEGLTIARYHILLIAMAACLVFGWLMSGRYYFGLAVVVCLDWFLINLLNRVTDIAEDLRNGIPGTERVAHRKKFLTLLCGGLIVTSFVGTHLVWPELSAFRAIVQLIGVAYNYRIIPKVAGFTRFKEMYFFKNFASACIFVLTCFVYPSVLSRDVMRMSFAQVAFLVVFFVPFELTYEILYDLRDIEGDRAENVPTFPVAHGETSARRIIDGLLIGSSAVVIAGFGLRYLGVRELGMVCAPIMQYVWIKTRKAPSFSSKDCVFVTNLGTAQLVVYLIGTNLWLRAGLPANVFL